ncbi:MAG: aminoacetone oxidase family FAD-binding enzyme [Planctomycetota bacterium]
MAAPEVDVVVAGGGAAGLFAAAAAARRGRRTVLLEKSERPGLKILISGGGRCNVTTTRHGQDLERQYGERRGRFLRHALHTLPPTAVAAHFHRLSVPLQEEDLEKLFPVSQRARDVLDALLRDATDAGVTLHTSSPVTDVRREGDRFLVTTARSSFVCSSVVFATGGLSYPKTGATGDGYPIAAGFGHTITACVPALAPLLVAEPWVRTLQGIVLHGVEIAVLDERGRVVNRRTRPILFTHRAFQGRHRWTSLATSRNAVVPTCDSTSRRANARPSCKPLGSRMRRSTGAVWSLRSCHNTCPNGSVPCSARSPVAAG